MAYKNWNISIAACREQREGDRDGAEVAKLDVELAGWLHRTLARSLALS